MRQTVKFINPVYKSDGSNQLIEVGDTVGFILQDGSTQDETVTAVSDDGRSISWEHDVNITRKEDVKAVDGDHVKTCPAYYGSYGVPDDLDPLDQIDPRND